MPDTPKILRRLRILEGSLVDRPANPGAAVLLFKREDELLGSITGTGEHDMPQLDAETKALFEEMQEQLGDLTAKNDALTKRAAEADEAKTALEKDLDKLKKAKPGVAPADADEEDPILKGISPVLRQRFQDLQKQVDDQNTRLQKQEEECEIAEATKMLAKRFPSLPFRPENLAPIWRKITKALQPDELISLERIFASHGALAQIADRDIGHPGYGSISEGDGGTDAWAAIVAKARDIRRVQPNFTEEQAQDYVMKTEPDLYKRYRQEAM